MVFHTRYRRYAMLQPAIRALEGNLASLAGLLRRQLELRRVGRGETIDPGQRVSIPGASIRRRYGMESRSTVTSASVAAPLLGPSPATSCSGMGPTPGRRETQYPRTLWRSHARLHRDPRQRSGDRKGPDRRSRHDRRARSALTSPKPSRRRSTGHHDAGGKLSAARAVLATYGPSIGYCATISATISEAFGGDEERRL